MEQGPGAPEDRRDDYEHNDDHEMTPEMGEQILKETDRQKVADKLEADRYAKVLRDEQDRLEAIARDLTQPDSNK
jgi:hypothetical protein